MEQWIELPRLALNYYWLMAAGLLVLSLIAGILGRKHFLVERIASRVGLYAAAYILSTMIVMGKVFGFASYQFQLDLIWILLSSIPLYLGLQIAYDCLLFKGKRV